MNRVIKSITLDKTYHIDKPDKPIRLDANVISIFGINDSGKTKLLDSIENFLNGKESNFSFEFNKNLKVSDLITNDLLDIEVDISSFHRRAIKINTTKFKNHEFLMFINLLINSSEHYLSYFKQNTYNPIGLHSWVNQEIKKSFDGRVNTIYKNIDFIYSNDSITFYSDYLETKLKFNIKNINLFDITNTLNTINPFKIQIDYKNNNNFELNVETDKDTLQYKYFSLKLKEACKNNNFLNEEMLKKSNDLLSDFILYANESKNNEKYVKVLNKLNELISKDFIYIFEMENLIKQKIKTNIHLSNKTVSFYIEYGDKTDLKFVTEDPLKNKSSGFLKIFNLMMNIFLYEEWTNIILIDEPEMTLNGAVQIKLYKVLNAIAKERDLTFILATHSHHFFDWQTSSKNLIIERYVENSPKAKIYPFDHYCQQKKNQGKDGLDVIINLLNNSDYSREYNNELEKILLVEGKYDLNLLKFLLPNEFIINKNQIFISNGNSKQFDAFKTYYFRCKNLFLLVDLDGKEKISDTKIYKDIKKLKLERKPELDNFNLGKNLITLGSETESIIEKDELNEFVKSFYPNKLEKLNKLNKNQEKEKNNFIKEIISLFLTFNKSSDFDVNSYFPKTIEKMKIKLTNYYK